MKLNNCETCNHVQSCTVHNTWVEVLELNKATDNNSDQWNKIICTCKIPKEIITATFSRARRTYSLVLDFFFLLSFFGGGSRSPSLLFGQL